MSEYTRAELLAAPPPVLAELLATAPGDSVSERAESLGLMIHVDQDDRDAVRAAVEAWDAPGDTQGPPGDGGDSVVRQSLTTNVRAGQTPMAGQGDPLSDALGLPEPDPVAADMIRAKMAESAGSGRPMMAGTFAAYADPSGALVMVTEDAAGVVQRVAIPPKVVRLALTLISGESVGLGGRMLRKMIGRG